MADKKTKPRKNADGPPHADALDALEKMANSTNESPDRTEPPGTNTSDSATAAPPAAGGRPQTNIPVALPVTNRPTTPPSVRLRGGSLVPTPTPRPVADDGFRPPSDDALGESGSASGFVSMLAKGMDGSDPLPHGPVVMPAVLAGGTNPVPKPEGKPKTLREKLAEQAARHPGASPRKQVRDIPGWYHAAAPLMLVVSGLLAVVSLWAILGSLALATQTQGVPLVQILVEGDPRDFWYYMPYIMLACIPVCAALAWMGLAMRQQIIVSRRRYR